MALNLISFPGDFLSVHSDIIFTAYESVKANDPVTYPDYRYVLDLEINGNTVARLKAYPRPDSKFGVFNIANIIRNYISPVFRPDVINMASLSSMLLGHGEFNVSGIVSIGEEYGFDLYPALITDSARTYFGHYNGRVIGNYSILPEYVGKFLTSRPYATPVFRGSTYHFISRLETNSTLDLTIEIYSAAGLTDTLTNNESAVENSCRVYNVAPQFLNAYAGSEVINYDTLYYLVKIGSEEYRFDVVCEPKYEVHTLHFLNKFNGFESRDFTKVSRKTVDVEKKDFGKLPYIINNNGGPDYFNTLTNVYNESRSVYASQFKEKMTLNTDLLTDREYQWLAELIISPMVYIQISGFFFPVTVSTTNYEYRKAVNDRKTNLTLTLEFGEQFNAQYR